MVNIENDVLTVLAAIRLNEFRQVIALDRINGSDIYTPKRRASVFVRKRDAFFKGVEGFDRVPIEFLAITCEFYGSSVSLE